MKTILHIASRTVGLVCVVAAPAVAQTGQADPPVYAIEYSSAPMIRNAALADVAVQVVERGSDWLLDKWTGDLLTRKSTGGVFARIGQIAWDALIADAGSAVAHEHGHASRAEEQGTSAHVVIGPLGFGSYFETTGGHRLSPTERLAVFGGGIEASGVLATRVGDRVHAGTTATPGDLTLLVFEALGSEGYILQTLREGRLSSPERFFEGAPRIGDPAQYVFDLAIVRSRALPPRDGTTLFAETQSIARRVRRGSLINFIDYDLASASVGLARDFLWRGERTIPVRWINLGSVSVSPGLRYVLSPNGPERQVRSRYKVGAHVGQGYVRWSDVLAPGSSRLLGAGGDYQHGTVRGFVPKMAFDLWRNPDGQTSVRSEASTTFQRSADDRLVLSFGLGVKGGGYLSGYPLASGTYFSVGAGLRF